MALLVSEIAGIRRVSCGIMRGMSVDSLEERRNGKEQRVVGQGEPCRVAVGRPRDDRLGGAQPPHPERPQHALRLDQHRPARHGGRRRLALFVENMDASIDFYTKVLGFEVLREYSGDYAS